MKTSTPQKQNGIKWTLSNHLDDFDLLMTWPLHTHQQKKTNIVTGASAILGLNLIESRSTQPEKVQYREEELEEVDCFPYICSTINKLGRIRTTKSITALV